MASTKFELVMKEFAKNPVKGIAKRIVGAYND